MGPQRRAIATSENKGRLWSDQLQMNLSLRDQRVASYVLYCIASNQRLQSYLPQSKNQSVKRSLKFLNEL
jgi:hypothetical protein